MDAVLIFDTETTGLDPAKDHVIEVGAALWSVRFRTTIACYSTLLHSPVPNGAETVNRVPTPALDEGATPNSVWERLSGWVERADAIVAHNAEFDRGFCPAGWDQGKKWICTQDDLTYPRSSHGRSLVAIALAHDIGVATAHRALADVQLIARLFERCAELTDIDAMLERGLRPKSRWIAQVSYADRRLASDAGFRWDGDKKTWSRMMADEDVTALPFKCRRAS